MQRIALADVPREHRIILGLDPAPGAEVDPDPSFFSMTIAALSAKHLDVLASIAVRIETTEQVELIAKYATAYAPVAGIAIAKIALDRLGGGAIMVGHPELRPLIHEHSINEASARPGRPKARLASLGSYAFSGWLRVVETAWTEQTAGAEDREQEESLYEQWRAYPEQNHDDRLDSLDVTVREALELMGTDRSQFAVVPTEGNVDEVGAGNPSELGPGEAASRVW
jgi:hypothetical protein